MFLTTFYTHITLSFYSSVYAFIHIDIYHLFAHLYHYVSQRYCPYLFPLNKKGISFLWMNSVTAHAKNTTTPRPKSSPPSPCTSIPSTKTWLSKAPLITPSPIPAPIQAVLGTRSKMAAISSEIPATKRPHGSTPSWERCIHSQEHR